MRIHLSGRMSIDAGDVLVTAAEFPGQQGRAAFAVLAGERGRAMARVDLADAIWPDGLPPSWDTALSSILSKLRTILGRTGLDAAAALTTRDGCHELRLPARTWIDHEVAADAIHEAEAALKASRPEAAYGPSAVAHHIARRPFLPTEAGRWFEQRRQRLEDILVRALECRAEVYLWNREHTLAADVARDAIILRPFRETGYQLLMRAHVAAGNTAEALRVYEDCRQLIATELGVAPSPETRALHTRLLRGL